MSGKKGMVNKGMFKAVPAMERYLSKRAPKALIRLTLLVVLGQVVVKAMVCRMVSSPTRIVKTSSPTAGLQALGGADP